MRHTIKLAILLAASLACAQQHARSQSTTVSFDSGSQLLYSTAARTTILTAGAVNTAGDGDVLQLGYFTGATPTNYFSGTFVPLSGPSSLDGFTATTIGDKPSDAGGDGTFALSLVFTSSATTLPSSGQLLSIRFYNGTTIANSTAFNTVSDASWLFLSPALAPPTVTISLDDLGIQFQGAGTAPVVSGPGTVTSGIFYTSISTVPEPSSFLSGGLICIGMLGMAYRRKQSAEA